MNTNAIRDVATKARRLLLEAVERRCLLYGIEEGAQREADTVNGRVLSAAERAQRRELLRIQDELRGDGKPGSGHAALVEQAAYTWFNRLFAIRFMELNDRLPSHVRMLSAPDGSFAPECLREAMDLPLDELDRAEVARLVAQGDDEGLFRLVLLAQCAELAECMPDVFERVGSAMELMLPDGLLAKDGVIESLVTGIPEDDWREGVEIVGWAYQFYVSERKDEFFKSKRKAGKDDIAPATQLFTPEYIVRFLVQNSLGRLWVLNNPDSPLAEQMEYFIRPDASSYEDYRKVESPEAITFIDPACGSGHFLCYAFDLLARMYEEQGYRSRDIARLVLDKNLTGIEIDRRAAALTSFALTMKACELDGRFLRRGVTPKVVCIGSVDLTPEECEAISVEVENQALINILSHLDVIGSLWIPTVEDKEAIELLHQRSNNNVGLFAISAADKLSKAQLYASILSKTYDVCGTNPPYMATGNLVAWASSWVKESYPSEKHDLCTCFIRRGLRFIHSNGYVSMVTMQNWMFLSRFEEMRTKLLQDAQIVNMAHFGSRAFDAISGEVVSTVATVLSGNSVAIDGTYIRIVDLLGEDAKAHGIIDAISTRNQRRLFRVNDARFALIPGEPIAYWASPSMLDSFGGELIGSCGRSSIGLITGDNDRYFRIWWEISHKQIMFDAESNDEAISSGKEWFPMNKGGQCRKWYGNHDYVIHWANDGKDVFDHARKTGHHAQDYDSSLKFKPNVTWSDVSGGTPSFRYRKNELSDHKGHPLYPAKYSIEYVLALLNSSVASEYLALLSPSMSMNIGEVEKIPIIAPSLEESSFVERLSRSSIALAREDWDSSETSWDFTKHPLLRGTRLDAAYGLWSSECKDRFDSLKSNEEQLNAIFARIYHMEDEVNYAVEDDKVSVRRADLRRDVRSLISFAVGSMFGRYSLDKPGLVLANQGDGLNEYLAQVPNPKYMPDDDGILPITDDEYFEDDIVAMFCEFLKTAYGAETLEENLQFVADALGGTGSARKVIRDYFMNQFFADHCAMYSVQGAGRRPIYWLIDSGKLGGFRALVYMHRYTPDLLARVRTDYVHERQERYRSRIVELEREREGASRREQSAIDKELKHLHAQLDEVTKFEERLHHLADQMIEIDLDDGFKVNYAKFADVMAKVK